MLISPKIKIICTVCLITTFPIYSLLYAQQLTIVKKTKIYRQKLEADSSQTMVELKSLIPELVYDLRYATKKNFTHEQLYKTGKATFLRINPAQTLVIVQAELNSKGYGLKIFDAYRPYHITQKMWELVHDERYVANPAKGSGHNRGLAVDLTVIDLRTGVELNMGTGFDNFTDTAHHSFKNLPDSILQNRMLLKETMVRQGFNSLETEWWHYSWPNNRKYDVLDIDFKKLRRIGD